MEGLGAIMADSNQSRYDQLRNVGRFYPATLKHIAEGDLVGGAAGGYHFEGLPNTPGRIIPRTAYHPDKGGVYLAKITVYGVPKLANGGYSSFFPKHWSLQDVVDAIN